MKKILNFVALSIALLITACGPNNPLMGTWVSDPVMGMSSTMEFSGSSVTSTSQVGGVEQSQVTKVQGYKVEKDKVGVVVSQGDNSAVIWYQIVDANTIEQDMGIIKVRFHRKK